jgi:TetR/AcrR family transcriptional regulator, transcriptional repressor for nem operon
MGRERSFDEAEILERAANVFSVSGFSGTSVAMLSDATGLGKQSLYNAFGDKEALYLKAMECAVNRFGKAVVKMQNAETGAEAMRIFFSEIAVLCSSNLAPERVCMVSAGLLEAIDAPEIQSALERKWAGTHELVRSTIERGQRDGSIQNRAPSVALADIMMSIMSGMRVAAKVESSRARLPATVELALQMLAKP